MIKHYAMKNTDGHIILRSIALSPDLVKHQYYGNDFHNFIPEWWAEDEEIGYKIVEVEVREAEK